MKVSGYRERHKDQDWRIRGWQKKWILEGILGGIELEVMGGDGDEATGWGSAAGHSIRGSLVGTEVKDKV